MSTDLDGAVGEQLAERVAQPVTAEEWLLLRFYRQLEAHEQVFMRLAIKAMATRDSPR